MSTIKNLLIYLPLLGLVISIAFNLFQFLHNKKTERQYAEQISPELECSYRYFAGKSKHTFSIKNVGLVDAINVWVQEDIYVVVGEKVYEGRDVPHLTYFMWEGSHEKMWDITKDDEVEIDLADFQLKAFSKLKEKWNATILNRWIVSFSSPFSSKRYRYEKYFIFDFAHGNFKEVSEIIGGVKLLNKVKTFIATGDKSNINIFKLTGEFEIDSPDSFLVNSDYSITPLYPHSNLTIADFNNSLLWISFSEIQPGEDSKGTIGYKWKVDNNKWEKSFFLGPSAQLYSQLIRSPLGYLSKKEAKLVESNPSLLKYYNKDHEPPLINADETLKKALDRYLLLEE